jgi:hypothetical protein
VRIRSYQATPGGTIHCTVTADDDLVVLELEGEFGGHPRLDVVVTGPGGDLRERVEDVPVLGGRELLWVETGEALRPLPSGRLELRLVAPGSGGDRVVAEYHLDHTAFRG